MRVAVTSSVRLPVKYYGGIERVVWDLAYELVQLGHDVFVIAPHGSKCEFARVICYSDNNEIPKLLPKNIDIIHFNTQLNRDFDLPHLLTIHGNCNFGEKLSKQAVFVSRNQASRHGSDVYVHNGLNFDRNLKYPIKRKKFHFLGKAAWRRKNVRGAILCAKKANRAQIDILGGTRLNFNMGFRFTPDLHARFHGMVDDDFKNKIISTSKGLVFPVMWNEPFGLAIIESLFAGCPVFGTPYGSLPELVTDQVGFLSDSSDELANAMKETEQWKPQECRDYATENFNSRKMALEYLSLYERVLSGEVLNKTIPTLIAEEPKLLPFR